MPVSRWTAKAAWKRTRKRMQSMRLTALAIGGDWGDENEYFVALADQLIERIDLTEAEIAEQIADGEGGFLTRDRTKWAT